MLRFLALLPLPMAAACASVPSGARAAPSIARHGAVQDALRVLDAWLAASVATREEPGLAIGIVHDQELVWTKGYGFADPAKKIAVTPKTLFRIASVTKLFTATAILQLRDAGKLHLDDPVSRHLPWFKPPPASATGPAITIRHLLTHTAGLSAASPGTSLNEYRVPTREELVRLLPSQRPMAPPEAEWRYSNLGLALAGEIVSAAAGEPWEKYVEEKVLRPLGMTATVVRPGPDTPGLAVGFGLKPPGAPRETEPFLEIGAEAPAGGMASNVEDLAKFAALQLRDSPAGGPEILRASTLREMHRVHWLHPDWKGGWGLGFSVSRVGGGVRIGHDGGFPGYASALSIDPARKLAVIALSNAEDVAMGQYVSQAFRLLGPAVAKAGACPRKEPTVDPAWEKLLGTYRWKRREMRIMVLGGELTMIFPKASDPWGTRYRLEPVSPSSFRLVAARPGAWLHRELLTFEVGPDGRVKAGTHFLYWLRQ
jgi:CubicO group peptidase (beta-lactamase class C family)